MQYSVIPADGSVTSIGGSAFKGCTGLISVTIPDSVTSIGRDAFDGCTGLTSIYYTGDVTGWCGISGLYYLMRYGSSSRTLYFGGNKVEGELIIPDSVTTIPSCAFYGCTWLTSIVIPDSVTSIGGWTFNGCTGLTSVTIPESVTSIGGGAFDNTAWYDNQPDGLVYAGKIAYKYKGTMPENTSITIKDGTLGICNSAFQNCTGLISITIPESVTSIDNLAFSGCTGLTSITIPDSVTSIGNGTFVNCTELTNVTIGSGVTSIANLAFFGCTKLTSITFEDTSSWYRTDNRSDWENKSGGTLTDISSATTNATYFTSTYDNFYWYKK